MSPRTGQMLLDSVTPMLRASIAKGAVQAVGSEDLQELEQDGMVQAANMLESVELSGKAVSPNSVAFYVLQTLRSGRRFGCASRTDVTSPATQLDGRAVMLLMDAPLDVFDEDDDEVDPHAWPGRDRRVSGASGFTGVGLGRADDLPQPRGQRPARHGHCLIL